MKCGSEKHLRFFSTIQDAILHCIGMSGEERKCVQIRSLSHFYVDCGWADGMLWQIGPGMRTMMPAGYVVWHSMDAVQTAKCRAMTALSVCLIPGS